MDSKASNIAILSLMCALISSISTTNAFNITKILSEYPDFATFNTLLNQTGLATQINSRQTITVLVVSNDVAGSLSGRPLDISKRILSTHVILDYYDHLKFSKLQKRSSILTTLYQTTGIANDQQGFLNVTKTPNGIMFGSAMKGAPLVASLVGSVTSMPYNLSVLQVSAIIEAPGIDGMAPPPPPLAPAPPKAPSTKAPTPSNEGSDENEAEAPSETPSEAPAPVDADADAPVISPSPSNDVSDDEVPSADKKNGSTRLVGGGLAIIIVGLVVSLLGF